MSTRPSVYLAGPIAGLTYDEASSWHDEATNAAASLGYEVYSPMRGKESLEKTNEVLRIDVSTNAGVIPSPFPRDAMDVRRCDVVVANLLLSETASIGTMIELGMAYALGKFIVLVLPEKAKSPFAGAGGHYHPFLTGITAAQGVIVHNLEAAYDVLETLLPMRPAEVQFTNAGTRVPEDSPEVRHFLELMDGLDEEDVFQQDGED